jgi:hypothetical protein
MKKRVALIVCAIAALVGFSASGNMLAMRTKNPEISLTLPPPELHPRLAALAGVWEASQSGLSPSRVVVEKINETWATVLHFWPNYRTGLPSGVWQRSTAKVLPDGELMWGYPLRFRLRATEGFGTLEIIKGGSGSSTTWELRRVGAFIAIPSDHATPGS